MEIQYHKKLIEPKTHVALDLFLAQIYILHLFDPAANYDSPNKYQLVPHNLEKK